jgi:hypothetical protein
MMTKLPRLCFILWDKKIHTKNSVMHKLNVMYHSLNSVVTASVSSKRTVKQPLASRYINLKRDNQEPLKERFLLVDGGVRYRAVTLYE